MSFFQTPWQNYDVQEYYSTFISSSHYLRITYKQVIKRLQDVAVGVVAPYAQLLANPLVGSVAVVEMADIAKSGLPPLPTGRSPLLLLTIQYLYYILL